MAAGDTTTLVQDGMLRAEPELTSAAHQDGTLIALFLAGDEAAFSRLLRLYEQPLFRLIHAVVRDADEAKDVMQQTFVKAFRALPGLHKPNAFRPWLFRIGLNQARNSLKNRQRRKEEPLDKLPDAADRQATAEEQLGLKQDWLAARKAIDRLPPRQQAVFLLHVDAGLAFADVARTVGSTETSARVNFHHALLKLRATLAEKE